MAACTCGGSFGSTKLLRPDDRTALADDASYRAVAPVPLAR